MFIFIIIADLVLKSKKKELKGGRKNGTFWKPLEEGVIDAALHIDICTSCKSTCKKLKVCPVFDHGLGSTTALFDQKQRKGGRFLANVEGFYEGYRRSFQISASNREMIEWDIICKWIFYALSP